MAKERTEAQHLARIRQSHRSMKSARERHHDDIVAAVDAGVSVTKIAGAAGVVRNYVYKIRDNREAK
jgi:hypothetical protein